MDSVTFSTFECHKCSSWGKEPGISSPQRCHSRASLPIGVSDTEKMLPRARHCTSAAVLGALKAGPVQLRDTRPEPLLLLHTAELPFLSPSVKFGSCQFCSSTCPAETTLRRNTVLEDALEEVTALQGSPSA